MKKLTQIRIHPGMLLVAAMVASLSFTQLSFAQETTTQKEDQGMCKKQSVNIKEMLTKELNLTPDQEKQLAENRKQNQEKRKELFNKMKENRIKLMEELNKPASDQKEIEKLKTEIKTVHNQVLDHQIEETLAIKTILTPEQFKKFSEKTQERHQKMAEQRKKHVKENMPPQEEE